MDTKMASQAFFAPNMKPVEKLLCLECKETVDLRIERLSPAPVLFGTAAEVTVTCNKCGMAHVFVEINYGDENNPLLKFRLGKLVSTQGVIAEIPLLDTLKALLQYSQGDWGILCDEDKAANDAALRDGDRIFAAYFDRKGTKFWIITEWDRSITTILLPSEY